MAETTAALLWLVSASALGFMVSAIFSAGLKLSRRKFLLVYVPLGAAFLAAFFAIQRVGWAKIFNHWYWGILSGVAVSLFLISNVRGQPKSRTAQGGELALDLLWLGLSYGLIDGLFLNVMPVLAVRQVFPQLASSTNLATTLLLAALGLLASLLIALTYHLGYREYRDRKVIKVLIGNGIITLAFLISGSPLAAVLSHVVMHLAAVFQGPETTLQLPPHRAEGVAQAH